MEEVAVPYAHQSGVGRIHDDDQNGKSLVAFQDWRQCGHTDRAWWRRP